MTVITRTVQASYDPTTDSSTLTTTTIEGLAVRTQGNPHRYAELGLVESKAPTLIFVPETYGDTPEPGDTLEWVNETYTIRDVQPWAPDGVTIGCSMVVST